MSVVSEEKLSELNRMFNDYLDACQKAGMDYRLVMQCTIAGLIDNCDCSKKEARRVTNEAIKIANRFYPENDMIH
jgi:hypothetical protein